MSEKHGVFISVEVDESVVGDPSLAKKLEEACPVDIYAATASGVTVVQENVDECVLCGLCLDAAPADTVRIRRLYANGALLER